MTPTRKGKEREDKRHDQKQAAAYRHRAPLPRHKRRQDAGLSLSHQAEQ